MKTLIKAFPVLFLLFFSCHQAKHPGYSETETGLFYKFLIIGDEDYFPRPDDFVSTHLEFKDENGNLVEDSAINRLSGIKTFQLARTINKGGLEEAISMMNPGDSACFILSEASFHKNEPDKLKQERLIYVSAKLLKIIDPKNYETIKDFEAWLNQKDDHERKLLTNYIKDNNIKVLPGEEGMYYIVLKEGKGDSVELGITIFVHYIGRFLDGTVFDNTYDTGNPLEFKFGVSDQVIKGMEIGISKMKKGGKAKFILPSHLAFGEKGSSTGIIPPNTTVIYEVELVMIK